MAIEFVCPACGGTLQVSDESAGRVVRCGGCMTMLRVPASAEPDPGAAPPSPFELPGSLPPSQTQPRERRSSATSLSPPDRDSAERPSSRSADSSEPRPARRRRRPLPPPPPGRGIFFWLVILGGVMFVGLISCCGLIALLTPGPKWHTHESKKGGFKVEMPAPPRNDLNRMAGVKPEKGMNTEGTVLPGKLETFVIVYRDIPPNVLDPETTLNSVVQDIRNDREVRTVISEKPITVNGFPGREVEFRYNNDGIYV